MEITEIDFSKYGVQVPEKEAEKVAEEIKNAINAGGPKRLRCLVSLMWMRIMLNKK